MEVDVAIHDHGRGATGSLDVDPHPYVLLEDGRLIHRGADTPGPTVGNIDVRDRRTREGRDVPARGETVEVAAERDLDDAARSLAGLPGLSPLAPGQRLTHHGATDVHGDRGEEEVRREAFADVPQLVALEDERVRLVLPCDAVLVEQARELPLDGMSEVGGHDTGFPSPGAPNDGRPYPSPGGGLVRTGARGGTR